MKYEPEIDKVGLAATVAGEYGIEVCRFTVVPKGWGSVCYVVECAHGGRYFLKLAPSARTGTAASDPDFYLPLTWTLYQRGLFRNLTYPIPNAQGEFRTEFGIYTLILFNYIDGTTLEEEDLLSERLLPLLAEAMGRIHASTPDIGIERPFTDGFELTFEQDLLRGPEVLRLGAAHDRSSTHTLGEILLPREAELRALLERTRELGERVRGLNPEMVLCHTDLWGANLMLDREGDLYVLDWETALLAPPEHDLFSFVDDARFPRLLEVYERSFRPVDLHPDTFAFYILRRNLEDLAAWVLRILEGEHDEEQDMDDLEGVRDSLYQWPGLEATIRGLSDKLSRRRG